MPNLKVYLDQNDQSWGLDETVLTRLRGALVDGLKVPTSACQLAVVPIQGLPGQPPANIELSVLSKPDRTPERLAELGQTLQDIVANAGPSRVAFRCTVMDRASYVVGKG